MITYQIETRSRPNKKGYDDEADFMCLRIFGICVFKKQITKWN